MSAEPCSSPAGHSRRFRELARAGFLLLVTADTDVETARQAAAGCPAPARVLVLVLELELELELELTAALAARPREVWVIRPDAHVAAVLEQPTGPALDTALRRALAALDPSG